MQPPPAKRQHKALRQIPSQSHPKVQERRAQINTNRLRLLRLQDNFLLRHKNNQASHQPQMPTRQKLPLQTKREFITPPSESNQAPTTPRSITLRQQHPSLSTPQQRHQKTITRQLPKSNRSATTKTKKSITVTTHASSPKIQAPRIIQVTNRLYTSPH